jgi:hypothetical protein
MVFDGRKRTRIVAVADLMKLDKSKSEMRRRQFSGPLLGLAFEGGSMEAVALRRTDGSVEIRKTLSVSLSLNLLTDDPVLVGREIQKHLAAAGLRERACVVCLPLSWALTLGGKLPDLPEDDLAGFLQIEAERGFPYAPEALVLACSRYRTPSGEAHATQVAVPREHVMRLEAVLKAAQLRPVSFSLGVTALQPPDQENAGGVIALVPGEHSVAMQVSCGGGVAVLRMMEGAAEREGGGEQRFQADQVARELRITYGQLPADVGEAVKSVRVFGRHQAADELTEELRPRLEPLGIKVEQMETYAPDAFGVKLPLHTPVSPAVSLAVRRLAGQASGFEFLPPKISAWRQFRARYASRKLMAAGATAAAVAVLVLLAFLAQQVQLIYWRAKWTAIKPRVNALEKTQQQIVKFRPWFDESHRSLSILRRLTEAFPVDGAVSAKVVGIRSPAAVTVTVKGNARSDQALLRTFAQLRAAQGVQNANLETMHGQSPIQFTVTFQWGGGGGGQP